MSSEDKISRTVLPDQPMKTMAGLVKQGRYADEIMTAQAAA